MFLHYFHKVIGYIPVIMCWLCFLYLLALYKAPELIADILHEDSTWSRRATIAIVFIGFFCSTFAGGGRLVLNSDLVRYWDEHTRYIVVGVPLFFGSLMVPSYLIDAGLNIAREHAISEREKKFKK